MWEQCGSKVGVKRERRGSKVGAKWEQSDCSDRTVSDGIGTTAERATKSVI